MSCFVSARAHTGKIILSAGAVPEPVPHLRSARRDLVRFVLLASALWPVLDHTCVVPVRPRSKYCNSCSDLDLCRDPRLIDQDWRCAVCHDVSRLPALGYRSLRCACWILPCVCARTLCICCSASHHAHLLCCAAILPCLCTQMIDRSGIENSLVEIVTRRSVGGFAWRFLDLTVSRRTCPTSGRAACDCGCSA